MFNSLKTQTQGETYDFVSLFINMKKHLDLARLADGFLCHSFSEFRTTASRFCRYSTVCRPPRTVSSLPVERSRGRPARRHHIVRAPPTLIPNVLSIF